MPFVSQLFRMFRSTEEKDKIIEELDCEKLNKDTYALVTSYLRRKGYFKSSKGFGK